MRRPTAPPSRAEWALDGELRGHTPGETVAYLAACADAEDEQQRVRALPVGVSPDAVPFARLRRWLGVGG